MKKLTHNNTKDTSMKTTPSGVGKSLDPQPAHNSPIWKELLALTKDYNHAIVLNHILLLAQRLHDFDLFVQEEKELKDPPHAYGWFSMTMQELVEETHRKVSTATMRKYTKSLENKGWVTERRNPEYKWSRKLQFRINLHKLQADLQALGCGLSVFSEDLLLSKTSLN